MNMLHLIFLKSLPNIYQSILISLIMNSINEGIVYIGCKFPKNTDPSATIIIKDTGKFISTIFSTIFVLNHGYSESKFTSLDILSSSSKPFLKTLIILCSTKYAEIDLQNSAILANYPADIVSMLIRTSLKDYQKSKFIDKSCNSLTDFNEKTFIDIFNNKLAKAFLSVILYNKTILELRAISEKITRFLPEDNSFLIDKICNFSKEMFNAYFIGMPSTFVVDLVDYYFELYHNLTNKENESYSNDIITTTGNNDDKSDL